MGVCEGFSAAADFGEDVVSQCFPDGGLGVVVPFGPELDGVGEVVDAAEAAAA
jgi:hypothetical protein